jgi:hypothetical protein
MKQFYAYLLIDPRNNLPFYVGKGQGIRMYQHTRPSEFKINPHKARKIKHIHEAGLQVQYQKFMCESEQAAFDLEKQLIQQYGRTYDGTGILTNLDHGGQGGSTGRVLSDETRQKLRNRPKGVKSLEGLQRIKEAVSGPKSDDHKKKLQANCPKAKPVQQLDKNTGEIVATFVSARDAGKQLGIDNVMISRCCTGAYKSAGGFLWRYA